MPRFFLLIRRRCSWEWLNLTLMGDGSSLGNPGPSGIGGLIRDNLGAHLLSFLDPSSFRLVNETDLLAFRTGLREA